LQAGFFVPFRKTKAAMNWALCTLPILSFRSTDLQNQLAAAHTLRNGESAAETLQAYGKLPRDVI